MNLKLSEALSYLCNDPGSKKWIGGKYKSPMHQHMKFIYQARYIPFSNIRQYTQINVYLTKKYGIVPIAYGCTEVRSQNKPL